MPRRPSGPPRFNGILVIDKPAGWTSHDVVARVRRLVGERQVGHAGTLDPAATGVLPVAVGSATRVVEYLADASKTYLAEVTFGVETDSHDIDGQVNRWADVSHVPVGDVEVALSAWRGPIEQIPPMHAAIKIGGRPLYERARRGEEIDRPPRRVAIHHLELTEWQPPVATLVVDCSKGTYIRALARDLGSDLGVGAYLSNLVRVRTGPFDLSHAWTLAELAELDLEAEWPTIAVHPDAAVEHLDALILDDDATRRWATGQAIGSTSETLGVIRVYDSAGEWLGIAVGQPDSHTWKPAKVIVSAS
ncbi:MAG: tRNA pseudouridine(55) synthase TruB [Thermomicrobiales bacterium]